MAFTGWYQPINWDLRQQGKTPTEKTFADIQAFTESQRRDEQLKAEIQEREAREEEFRVQAQERAAKAQDMRKKAEETARNQEIEREAFAAGQKFREQNPEASHYDTLRVITDYAASKGHLTPMKEANAELQKKLGKSKTLAEENAIRKYFRMSELTPKEWASQWRPDIREVEGHLINPMEGTEVVPELTQVARTEKRQAEEEKQLRSFQNQMKLQEKREADIRSRPVKERSTTAVDKAEQTRKDKLYRAEMELARIDGRIAATMEDPVLTDEQRAARLNGLMKLRGVTSRRVESLTDGVEPTEEPAPIVEPTQETSGAKQKFQLPSKIFGAKK